MPCKLTFSLAIIALCVSACATSQPLRGPSGRPGFTVNCSGGSGGRWHDCYNEASNLCPSGYTVLDRVGSTEAMIGGRDEDIWLETSEQRELVIECN